MPASHKPVFEITAACQKTSLSASFLSPKSLSMSAGITPVNMATAVIAIIIMKPQRT